MRPGHAKDAVYPNRDHLPPPMSASPRRVPFEIIRIHGTAAALDSDAGDAWWQHGSSLQIHLARLAGKEAELIFPTASFHWSGANSERERRAAGERFCREWLLPREQAGVRFYVVAHSHDGSVLWHALEAATERGAPLKHFLGACTVGTPFLHYVPRRVPTASVAATALLLAGAMAIAAVASDYREVFAALWHQREWLLLVTSGWSVLVLFALFVAGLFSLVAAGLNQRRSRQRTQIRRDTAARFGPRIQCLVVEGDEACAGLRATLQVRSRILPRLSGPASAGLALRLLRWLGVARAIDYLVFTAGDDFIVDSLTRKLQGSDVTRECLAQVTRGPLDDSGAVALVAPEPAEEMLQLARQSAAETFRKVRDTLAAGPSRPDIDAVQAILSNITAHELVHTRYFDVDGVRRGIVRHALAALDGFTAVGNAVIPRPPALSPVQGRHAAHVLGGVYLATVLTLGLQAGSSYRDTIRPRTAGNMIQRLLHENPLSIPATNAGVRSVIVWLRQVRTWSGDRVVLDQWRRLVENTRQANAATAPALLASVCFLGEQQHALPPALLSAMKEIAGNADVEDTGRLLVQLDFLDEAITWATEQEAVRDQAWGFVADAIRQRIEQRRWTLQDLQRVPSEVAPGIYSLAFSLLQQHLRVERHEPDFAALDWAAEFVPANQFPDNDDARFQFLDEVNALARLAGSRGRVDQIEALAATDAIEHVAGTSDAAEHRESVRLAGIDGLIDGRHFALARTAIVKLRSRAHQAEKWIALARACPNPEQRATALEDLAQAAHLCRNLPAAEADADLCADGALAAAELAAASEFPAMAGATPSLKRWLASHLRGSGGSLPLPEDANGERVEKALLALGERMSRYGRGGDFARLLAELTSAESDAAFNGRLAVAFFVPQPPPAPPATTQPATSPAAAPLGSLDAAALVAALAESGGEISEKDSRRKVWELGASVSDPSIRLEAARWLIQRTGYFEAYDLLGRCEPEQRLRISLQMMTTLAPRASLTL